MKLITDLHIHSKYSRGCSKELDLKNLEKYAKVKGVDLLGTGDFTHPEWIKHLKENLTDDGSGILKTKTNFPFVLQTEISLIYTQGNKGRRIHHVVLAPSLEIVAQITDELLKHGRVDYDGRPIFKIPSDQFVEMLRKISKEIEVIPAHCLTPWFSIFGSMSGFDTVEECFKDQTKHIHALETGLSADPSMIWRVDNWSKYALISSSDCHSFWPWRIGREATTFDIELNYKSLINAIRTKKGIVNTQEINPLFGKYHFTGHRNCNVCLHPKDALKLKNMCPKCGRQLTIGVMERVEELADRPEGYVPKNAIPFKTLIPLSEILSTMLGKGIATKGTWQEYYKILKAGKSENDILLNVPKEELLKVTTPKIVDWIIENREGKIKVKAGYDGVYGELILNESKAEEEQQDYKVQHKQKGLDEFFG